MSRCSTSRRMLAVAALLAILSPPALAFDDGSAELCQAAGAEAEQLHSVPSGLLLAIGRVESGRRHPATGMVAPWPWTINAAGAGRQFESGVEALGITRLLRTQGVSSIDVGCFQVNLAQHPSAFASLEDAFDPHANADYAARFLAELHMRTGSWEQAVAAYHSSTPELGGPYRDRVMAGWAGGGAVRTPPSMPLMQPSNLRVWTFSSSQSVRVWTPSAPGTSPSVIPIRSAQTQEITAQVVRPATGTLVVLAPASPLTAAVSR